MPKSSNISSQPQVDLLEVWFRKMGYNPSQERMRQVLTIIRSSPNIAYSFDVLRRNVGPVEDVEIIKKNYACRLLQNGIFNDEICKRFSIRSKCDLDRSRQFYCSEKRIDAYKYVKLLFEKKKLSSLLKELNTLAEDNRNMTFKSIKLNGSHFNLSRLHTTLIELNKQLESVKCLSKIVTGKRQASSEFQQYIQRNQEHSLGSANDENSSSTGLVSVEDEAETMAKLTLFFNNIQIPSERDILNMITQNSDADSNVIPLRVFLSDFFDKSKQLFNLLTEVMELIIKCRTVANFNSSDCMIKFKDMETKFNFFIKEGTENAERSSSNLKKIELILGDKLSDIEAILNKWGTSVYSHDTSSVLKQKNEELKFYDFLHFDESISLNFEVPISELSDVLQPFENLTNDLNNHITSFQRRIKEFKALENTVISLASRMSHVKINGTPVSDFIFDTKVTVLDFERLMNQEI